MAGIGGVFGRLGGTGRAVLSSAKGSNDPMSNPTPCPHARTRLIAKDSDAEYVECLDCGAIVEAGERPEQEPGFEGSLSDA